MSSFNVNQNHPLIPREQNYLLEKKIISFHSEDRDVKKWPKSNIFQVQLPETLSQIQSMRLVSISFPSNQCVFSRKYQNTKFNFTIILQGEFQEHDVEISEGTYTAEQLVLEISNIMNKSIIERNITTYVDINTQTFFKCKYNKVKNTFWFGILGQGTPIPFKTSRVESFSLKFEKKMPYNTDCNSSEVWNNSSKWGLPYYLGYQKKTYISTDTPNNIFLTNSLGDPFGFNYEITTLVDLNEYWLSNTENNLFIDISSNPCTMDIHGDDWIYMEIEKYNGIDEIHPYSNKTSNLYNNDYNGKVNNSFAKIPVNNIAFSKAFVKNRNLLSNISYYTPPLSRINRLKFKFRYHDGRLVDFKCMPISFAIEFNLLRDEPAKRMNVIVPPSYMFS
jgi:hypothetical protein|tara:strand:+ start:1492 stop:2664 length:1173 start_codon:yes stop_codon:yes gene_type:complete